MFSPAELVTLVALLMPKGTAGGNEDRTKGWRRGDASRLLPISYYMGASVGMHRRTRGILFNKTPPQASLITALTSSLTSALA